MTAPDPSPPLRVRNRRTARVLLVIMAVLALAALLTGVRW
jgi:hypothetical protein